MWDASGFCAIMLPGVAVTACVLPLLIGILLLESVVTAGEHAASSKVKLSRPKMSVFFMSPQEKSDNNTPI
jgi:hypothetical protein